MPTPATTTAEAFLLAFHSKTPGCTRIAFADGQSTEGGGSSYQYLARLATEDKVLDLGCGDGHLLSLLGKRPGCPAPIGVDLSTHELRAAARVCPQAHVVQARAQALPFADQSFSLVLSHLAFHLMSQPETVMTEVARVLEPGGRFAAIVGGGPKLDSSFESFLKLIAQGPQPPSPTPRIGEMRTRTDQGLKTLFAEQPAFVSSSLQLHDFYVDFGGPFETLWPRLATLYELAHYRDAELDALQASFAELVAAESAQHIPCTMALRLVLCQTRL